MGHAPEPDVFGALLRHYRLGARLTQEILAERAGLAVRSIPGLESGEHRPQRSTLRRLADALGLAPDQRRRFEAAAGRLMHSRDTSRLGDAHHPPHNLPVQLTSFIGREQEVADGVRLVNPANPQPRLVTLTGTGGCREDGSDHAPVILDQLPIDGVAEQTVDVAILAGSLPRLESVCSCHGHRLGHQRLAFSKGRAQQGACTPFLYVTSLVQ